MGFALGTFHASLALAAILIGVVSVAMSLIGLELGNRIGVRAGDRGESMNHTNALYFTVTVFATVGFGDITAQTETAPLLVTGQMITDLIILGLGARVILGAVQRGRQRQPHGTNTA